ncbi:MAG: hypothetical protein KGL39_34275 [Patescibacteria group bacterium]|nr:hypothetical protein [Patescibacteria group bacterium]
MWEQNKEQSQQLQYIGVICNTQSCYREETNRANARLIAAAPELLEALEDMMQQFVDKTVRLEDQFESAIVIKIVEHAQRALAKANGV